MRILIASGGSGGHIFPAVSLAKEIRKNSDADIIFAASRRDLDRDILRGEPYEKVFLSANPMPYKLSYKIIVFLFKFIMDSFQAVYILSKYRPGVVVGFGGYTSGSIVLVSAFLRIKTVVHEQNLVPGRTNKLLDKIVDRLAVSFEDTKKYLSNKNIIFTGNPIRRESLRNNREEGMDYFKLDRGRTTFLIMGGSQGARSLNELVSRSLCLLPESKKAQLQLVHITGPTDAKKIAARYSDNKINGKVFPFIKEISQAYSVCDIAISRSGAAAIFELAAFKKPMILIPYPNPKNNQRFNAEFFELKGAAVCIDESKTTDTELKEIINGLLDDPGKRKSLSDNAMGLSIKDAAERLKNVVLEVARNT